MSFHTPPQVLRIKRKRGQDPLQALILEESHPSKRSKPSSPMSSTVISRANTPTPQNIYFALTRTDESTAVDASVIESVLSEASRPDQGNAEDPNTSANLRKRKFVIPKKQTEEDTYIPHELSDMISSLLSNTSDQQPQRKRRSKGGPATTQSLDSTLALASPEQAEIPDHSPEITTKGAATEDPMSSEYVYDVYQISSEPLTNENHPQSKIGYIRFFDDEENGLYQSDDDDDPTRKVYSDDEDSNAESFYQNDYPSDEDAGGLSDTFPNSEGENSEDEDDNDLGPVIIQRPEDADGVDYLSGGQSNLGEENFEDLYDDFFDDEDPDGDIDFLTEDGGKEDFKRQNFFPNEEDDEVAIHRDKIFGRLQKMIDEEP